MLHNHSVSANFIKLYVCQKVPELWYTMERNNYGRSLIYGVRLIRFKEIRYCYCERERVERPTIHY